MRLICNRRQKRKFELSKFRMNISRSINTFKWPFLLSRPTILLLTVVLLSACASTAKTESAYNLGVEAYRAKDYVAAREYWARAIDDGQLYAYNRPCTPSSTASLRRPLDQRARLLPSTPC